MKKWTIYLIMILLLAFLTSATIKDCEEVMVAKDLPCMIVSTFKYPNPCETYTIKFYNSTPSLVGQVNMTTYGIAERCNTTFNFTTPDSYIFNITSGENGRLIVGRQDNMLAIVIGLAIIAAFFIMMGLMNPGKSVGKFSIRVFAYGVALIQIVNIIFALYANEQGVSLVSTLKINFIMMLILGFAIGFVALTGLTGRLINPSDEEMQNDDSKWSGRVV